MPYTENRHTDEHAGKRLRAAFDLDDVLKMFNEWLLKFCISNYGLSYNIEDLTSFDLSPIWGCTREELNKRIGLFFQSPYDREALPTPGSQRAIAALACNYDLFVVTARPEIARIPTLTWIQQHFPNTFMDVILTNQFGYTHGMMTTKAAVCQTYGVDIMVEDALHNALELAQAGIPVLLQDKPWNQGTLPQLITRVYTWDEIEYHINQLAQQKEIPFRT